MEAYVNGVEWLLRIIIETARVTMVDKDWSQSGRVMGALSPSQWVVKLRT